MSTSKFCIQQQLEEKKDPDTQPETKPLPLNQSKLEEESLEKELKIIQTK